MREKSAHCPRRDSNLYLWDTRPSCFRLHHDGRHASRQSKQTLQTLTRQLDCETIMHETLQLLSAGPQRQASARTSAESDEACQRKTKDRADGMRDVCVCFNVWSYPCMLMFLWCDVHLLRKLFWHFFLSGLNMQPHVVGDRPSSYELYAVSVCTCITLNAHYYVSCSLKKHPTKAYSVEECFGQSFPRLRKLNSTSVIHIDSAKKCVHTCSVRYVWTMTVDAPGVLLCTHEKTCSCSTVKVKFSLKIWRYLTYNPFSGSWIFSVKSPSTPPPSLCRWTSCLAFWIFCLFSCDIQSDGSSIQHPPLVYYCFEPLPCVL